jgi:ubiquitin-like protein ATG12
MTSPSPAPSSPKTGTNSPPPSQPTVPDEDPGVDLPMTMSASVILTNLPKDASEALGEVEALDKGKGMYGAGS